MYVYIRVYTHIYNTKVHAYIHTYVCFRFMHGSLGEQYIYTHTHAHTHIILLEQDTAFCHMSVALHDNEASTTTCKIIETF
jgi:hypothetical protein